MHSDLRFNPSSGLCILKLLIRRSHLGV